MAEQQAAVAVYSDHAHAEAAVARLREAGIAIAGVSVVGGGEPAAGGQASGHYTSAGQVRHQGRHGGLWALLSNLLLDTGTFTIPGAGPVFVAGPVVGWIATELEGDRLADDLDPIGAGLVRAGIPREHLPDYERALRRGDVLVIVHGAADEVARAKAVLDTTGAGVARLHGE